MTRPFTKLAILAWPALIATLLLLISKPAQAQPDLRIPEDVELTRDVEFGKGGDRPLKLHLIAPKTKASEPMPVVVWIHGGAWQAGSRHGGIGRMIPFAQHGYLGVSIEYRLSQEAVFPAQIEDCKCAIRYLRAHAKDLNLDPNRIGVWGSSAGGHLAALLGTSAHVAELEGKGGWADQPSKVQAVCDFCGPADFPKWGDDSHPAVKALLGGPVKEKDALAALASPVTHVKGPVPPFLIVHGDNDKTVPHTQSESLAAALKKANANVTLRIIPGGGHGIGDRETMRAVQAFFAEHLKTPQAAPKKQSDKETTTEKVK